MSAVRGVILAAGEGTRLRPLTATVPKPLVPVLNRPMIGHALDAMRRAGVAEVVANAWYLAETLVGRLGSGPPEGPWLRWSVEPELLGTGGGVRRAASLLRDLDELLVINGDVLALADLGAALEAHRRSGALATLVVTRRPDLPASLHKVAWEESTGRVVEVDGVPALHGPGFARGIYTGMLVASRALVEALPASGPACLKEDGFWPLLRAGAPLHAVETGAYWSDVGTPESYLRTNMELLVRLAHQASSPPAAPQSQPATGEDDGPGRSGGAGAPADLGGLLPDGYVEEDEAVFVHRSARIQPGAVVDGPSLIGPDTIVQDGAVVGPGAVVGARCTLTPSAHVRASVVWDGVIVRGPAVQQVWWQGGVVTAPQGASRSRR